MELTLVVHRADGKDLRVPVLCRIDTLDEVAYYHAHRSATILSVPPVQLPLTFRDGMDRKNLSEGSHALLAPAALPSF